MWIWILEDDEKGVFVLPKEVLIKHKIVSTSDVLGKMGFRVYTQDKDLNKTATKTYLWMKGYYFSLEDLRDMYK